MKNQNKKNKQKITQTHTLLSKTKEEVKYHPNGKMGGRIHYLNNKIHGMMTMWYENGTKLYEGMWVDDKNHGPSTRWAEDGSKLQEEMWKNGNKHGVQTEWYESGMKRHELMYGDGKQHGVGTAWDKNGKKSQEEYRQRVNTYAWVEWDEDGNVTKYRSRNKQNQNQVLLHLPKAKVSQK